MIKKGTQVQWRDEKGELRGRVYAIYPSKILKIIDGNRVIRNGVNSNKALYIKSDDGCEVLKLESEVRRIKT